MDKKVTSTIKKENLLHKSLSESNSTELSLSKDVKNFSKFYIAQRGKNNILDKETKAKEREEKLKFIKNRFVVSREDRKRLSTLWKMAHKINEERRSILTRVWMENLRLEASEDERKDVEKKD